MKYGVIFAIFAALLVYLAGSQDGFRLFMLWPALSLAVVAAGYLRLGPGVYGKSSQGVLSPAFLLLLLPYLALMWFVWHVARWLKSEPPVNRLADNLWIGRRLLSHERPDDIDHVIDLTCEFTEPRSLRSGSYHSFQILDGHVARLAIFSHWVEQAASLSGNVYVHCAEGHGRTGMFAGALLLRRGSVSTVEEAVEMLQSERPQIHLSRGQLALLRAYADSLETQSSNP